MAKGHNSIATSPQYTTSLSKCGFCEGDVGRLADAAYCHRQREFWQTSTVTEEGQQKTKQ
jgi:hypothetical protein